MLRTITRTAVAVAAGLLAGLAASGGAAAQSGEDGPRWALVVHGGAGVIERDSMDGETEAAYRAALNAALARGGAILAEGGAAADAVEAVIRGLEDDPLFNAGRGAVFTAEGRNELDASMMVGSTLQAGAVAGVTTVRHPISLARAVMQASPHVMLVGPGAEAFAAAQGLQTVEPAFFFTERRWASMERAVARMGLPIPERPEGAPAPSPVREGALRTLAREHAFGTVGVVARDMSGETVAGTSTGGTTAKRWGRVGDSPIIGAGTYAAADCGVSATGTGEYFIRLLVAARVCMEAEDAGSVAASARSVIFGPLSDLGGDGGVVALDGVQPAWAFNTPGMYRAALVEGGEPVVAIFADEE